LIKSLNKIFRPGVFFFLALLLLMGCEEGITSLELEDNAFSIYGVINPLEEVQALRVFQIDELLELTRPEPIDANVQSTDLNTGEMVAWQDSLVRFSNGKYGHVFWAPFQAQHEHEYRLEVIRSDGVNAKVVTLVPPLSTPEIHEYDSDGFFVTLQILWRRAPHLIDIKVGYHTNVGFFDINYNLQQTKVDGGQIVTIDFREDIKPIFRAAFAGGLGKPVLFRMDMRVVVTDENWDPPGGVFDANVFSEPGTFSNVVDGFGFVGSGYAADISWIPPVGILRQLGFSVPDG